MDKSTTIEYDARNARNIVGNYSELHDADLTCLSLRPRDQILTICFEAEEYDSEATSSLTFVCCGVRALCIFEAPTKAPGFEDYAFPVNTLIDGVKIEVRDCLVHVLVHGTYGWRIEFGCEGIRINAAARRMPDSDGLGERASF